jgi:hypothetical protein
MEISDYGRLRGRAEQCRAKEMLRLWALLKRVAGAWHARRSRRAPTGLPAADSVYAREDLA